MDVQTSTKKNSRKKMKKDPAEYHGKSNGKPMNEDLNSVEFEPSEILAGFGNDGIESPAFSLELNFDSSNGRLQLFQDESGKKESIFDEGLSLWNCEGESPVSFYHSEPLLTPTPERSTLASNEFLQQKSSKVSDSPQNQTLQSLFIDNSKIEDQNQAKFQTDKEEKDGFLVFLSRDAEEFCYEADTQNSSDLKDSELMTEFKFCAKQVIAKYKKI